MVKQAAGASSWQTACLHCTEMGRGLKDTRGRTEAEHRQKLDQLLETGFQQRFLTVTRFSILLQGDLASPEGAALDREEGEAAFLRPGV